MLALFLKTMLDIVADTKLQRIQQSLRVYSNLLWSVGCIPANMSVGLPVYVGDIRWLCSLVTVHGCLLFMVLCAILENVVLVISKL
jgi:hypothetical protein